MSRVRDTEKTTLIGYIILFIAMLIIGFWLGVGLAIVFFALLGQFIGSISTILGTFLGLAILIIILFSGRLFLLFRVAIYGLVVGIILSIIINHTLMQSMGTSAYSGSILFWIPAVLIIGLIIFCFIYIMIKRFTIVRRKDLVFGIDPKKKKKKKKR